MMHYTTNLVIPWACNIPVSTTGQKLFKTSIVPQNSSVPTAIAGGLYLLWWLASFSDNWYFKIQKKHTAFYVCRLVSMYRFNVYIISCLFTYVFYKNTLKNELKLFTLYRVFSTQTNNQFSISSVLKFNLSVTRLKNFFKNGSNCCKSRILPHCRKNILWIRWRKFNIMPKSELFLEVIHKWSHFLAE